MKIDQVTVVKMGILVPVINEEMKIMVDDIALKNLFTTLLSVYQIIKKNFNERYSTYKVLNDKQVISHVKNM